MAEGWQVHQNPRSFKARTRAGKAGLPRTVKTPSPEETMRAVKWRTDWRPNQNKRLRSSIEVGSLEEQPLKRLRHKTKNQWRFWLPHSSEMEGEEPLRAPFAGGNSSEQIPNCEQLAPDAGLDRLLAVGEGIFPKKLDRADNQFDQADQIPSGGDCPCVRLEEERVAAQNEPSMASSAAEQKSDGVAAAALLCQRMWRHDARAIRIGSNQPTPLLLCGIFGRDIRRNLLRHPKRHRSPKSSGIRIPNNHWEARLCLGHSDYSVYKNRGLKSTRPPNLERWCASFSQTQPTVTAAHLSRRRRKLQSGGFWPSG
ncbi:unnamed protein product [Linum trigynum]|uniref:Uncharacterized protein n=1 Tax=Linum trigynum TaxID=586398 RepID=A0AAV2GG11_9ROSI